MKLKEQHDHFHWHKCDTADLVSGRLASHNKFKAGGKYRSTFLQIYLLSCQELDKKTTTTRSYQDDRYGATVSWLSLAWRQETNESSEFVSVSR